MKKRNKEEKKKETKHKESKNRKKEKERDNQWQTGKEENKKRWIESKQKIMIYSIYRIFISIYNVYIGLGLENFPYINKNKQEKKNARFA